MIKRIKKFAKNKKIRKLIPTKIEIFQIFINFTFGL